MTVTTKKPTRPPVADYLGLNLKEQGIETFNDTKTNGALPSKTQASADDTDFVFLKDLSRNEEYLSTIAAERCRPWDFADRLDTEMGDIDALALSISKHGQQEPILVRPLENDVDGKEFEVIFGNRRWKACLSLGIPVKAIVKSISTQEAAVAQKEENENREDISDYTKAIYYKKLLDKKIFSSLAQLSEKMGIGKTTLSDLLSYTRINKDIISAMTEPNKLSRASAVKLATISAAEKQEQIQMLVKIALDIQNGKIPAKKIDSYIQATMEKHIPFTAVKQQLKKIKNETGKTLFICKTDSKNNYHLIIPNNVASKVEKGKIEQILASCLNNDL